MHLPTMTDGDRKRIAYAQRNGMDVMYAEVSGGRYDTWTYAEGRRYFLKPFSTLRGLQDYAKRRNFAIVYVA